MGLHADPRRAEEFGHHVGRSTIARILRTQGIPPVPERPTSWQTFLRAHWGEIAGADFFTTEVWTWRGLITFYTVFVIDLASRRVQILGSTPHPDEAFMRQTRANPHNGRRWQVSRPDLRPGREVERSRSAPTCRTRGIRVIQTPYRAPNANAHAERFVRSIKEECLDRLIPFGERHFRRAVAEFVGHYHRERNHQGLANELIDGQLAAGCVGRIHRRRGSVGCSTTTHERREESESELRRRDETLRGIATSKADIDLIT